MRHPIIMLLLSVLVLVLVLVTTGCGYHLHGKTQVPKALQKLTLSSADPYGPVTRAIREQLRLSNVTIVDNAARTDLPSLRILGATDSSDTVSIFANGKTAEYQMQMTINAQVLLPDSDLYPVSATVFRSFFDNPQTALAKDAEQEILRQEMRTQAAQQLLRTLLTVQAEKQKRLTTSADHVETP